MSNDIVLQITQATQRTNPLYHFKVLQPLPLSDDERDADDEAAAEAQAKVYFRDRSRGKSKDSDDDVGAGIWTEQTMQKQQQQQSQDHPLKACCVRNTPIVSNWLYQNITTLSMYLLKTALAQIRKITA
jgi:hypothetical protein